MATMHSPTRGKACAARAGQWRTPAVTFPHPHTVSLDGEDVTIIVTNEQLSTRTRKKKYGEQQD